MILGPAVIPSSLCWSWLAQHRGAVPAFAVGLRPAGGLARWPRCGGRIAGATASALLLGGTFLGIVVMAMMLARQHDPHGGSRTVGVMTSAYGLAQVIGPLIAAALAARPDAIGVALEIAAATLLLGLPV